VIVESIWSSAVFARFLHPEKRKNRTGCNKRYVLKLDDSFLLQKLS
jgi:hypothetical protein